MRIIKQFHAAQLMYTYTCTSNLRSQLRHIGQYVMPLRHIPRMQLNTHMWQLKREDANTFR